jgi:diphthine-ammonia ligase
LKKNAVAVNLLISDMSKFGEINKVYSKYFGLKPPVRACVAIPSKKLRVQVTLNKTIEALEKDNVNLHV